MKYSFLIKTTGDRPVLAKCIQSIIKKFSGSDYEILIADDCLSDSQLNTIPWKKNLYKSLVKNGHSIVKADPESVTKSRNIILRRSRGEIVVRLDDDFQFGDDFNKVKIESLLQRNDIFFVATSEKQFGIGKGMKDRETRIQSGHIKRFFGLYWIKMIRDDKWIYDEYEGVRFAKCSYSRNLLFLKRQVFNNIEWNEDLVFEGEHIDFYLQLFVNNIEGCFTPDVNHWHREDLKDKAQIQLDRNCRGVRSSISKSKFERLKRRWGNVPIKYGISIKFTIKMFLKRIVEKYA